MMYEDDEVWDEERWEAFLKEHDRHLDRFMDLLFRFLRDDPPPHRTERPAYAAWEDRLRTYLTEKGLRHDDAFLRPFLGGSPEEAADTASWLFGEVEPEDEPPGAEADVRSLPVYRHAFRLATRVLEWSNRLPGHQKDGTFVQFCSSLTQIPVEVANGHGLGYERETLGGNIACAKRGLRAANDALVLLSELRYEPFLDGETYRLLYEQLYELRNELGIYVQELRRRFDLGID